MRMPVTRTKFRNSASPIPLFIVRHQHPPDGCPAHDPFMGARLLNHRLREFLTPFQVAGSVDIYPASAP